MKRLLCAAAALAGSLAASARADIIIPQQREPVAIKLRTPLDALLERLPLILVIALLIVTALLVRRFTRRK